MIYRSKITELVLQTLASVGKPVGDSDTPSIAFGWDGQPNALGTNFIPYLVVFPQTATISSGPFSSPSADWQVPYTVTSYGVSREQCEWLADRARNTLRVLRNTMVDGGDGSYLIQKASTEAIGTVSRQDVTDPPFFSQTDTVSIWVSKELNP